jgi:ABC-type dipeptide/oligopeptide/nickel transport system permease subunit
MAVADQSFSNLDASDRLRSRSRLPDWLRTLLRNPVLVGDTLLVIFFVAIAIFASVLASPETPSAPFQITHSEFQAVPQPPGAQHPFGTTQGQYDNALDPKVRGSHGM